MKYEDRLLNPLEREKGRSLATSRKKRSETQKEVRGECVVLTASGKEGKRLSFSIQGRAEDKGK